MACPRPQAESGWLPRFKYLGLELSVALGVDI